MQVTGDSGHVYDVSWRTNEAHFICTCPDFKYRHSHSRDYACKHIKRCNMPTPVRSDGRKKRESFLELIGTINSMLKDICQYEIAGSFRREKEFIGDLDYVILLKSRSDLSELIERIELIGSINSKGDSRIISVINEIQCDFRIVPSAQCWGSMMAHCTGSKEENIRLRIKSKALGFTLNEYGIFGPNGDRIAGITEESIYTALGKPYKEPKDR